MTDSKVNRSRFADDKQMAGFSIIIFNLYTIFRYEYECFFKCINMYIAVTLFLAPLTNLKALPS